MFDHNHPADHRPDTALEDLAGVNPSPSTPRMIAAESITNPEVAASIVDHLDSLPPLPDPRHSGTPRPHYEVLEDPAVNFTLKLDRLTDLLDAPLLNNAAMAPSQRVGEALGRGSRFATFRENFNADHPAELIRSVAYLHAVADLGLEVSGSVHERVHVEPVVPSVGTLALVSVHAGEAEDRAFNVMGEDALRTLDPAGNYVWPVVLAGVELEPGSSFIFPQRPGDRFLDADISVTTPRLTASLFFRLVRDAGYTVAPEALCKEIGVEYHGPGEATDLSRLTRLARESSPGQYGQDTAVKRGLYSAAQARAVETLMVSSLLPDYHLAERYPWGWGTHGMNTANALADIADGEDTLREARRADWRERLRREGEVADNSADVELVTPGDVETGVDLTVVPHLVARGQTTAITGPQGGGKSGVVRELAATLANPGHKFATRWEATTTGGVLVLDLENNAAGIAAYRREGDGLDAVTIISADTGIRNRKTGEYTSFPAVLAKAADGNMAAAETVKTVVAARGPFHAVMVDGFKRLVELAGYTERQEENAARLIRGLEDLAVDLTEDGEGTLVVSTHTTRNDEITSGVAVDRYADIVVRLRTSARPGVTPGAQHHRSLETTKRGDLAGSQLERTRLELVDGALVLAAETAAAKRDKAAEAEVVLEDPLEAAVLEAAPAPGQPGLGMRKLTEAAAELAGVGRRQLVPVVERLVESGALTDQAERPFRAPRGGAYYARA